MKDKKNSKKKELVLIHATQEQTFDDFVKAGTTLGEVVGCYLEARHLSDCACDAYVSLDGQELRDPDTILQHGAIVRIITKVVDLSKTEEDFERKLKAYQEGTLDPATDDGFSERMDQLGDILPKLLGVDIDEGPQEEPRAPKSRRSRRRK